MDIDIQISIERERDRHLSGLQKVRHSTHEPLILIQQHIHLLKNHYRPPGLGCLLLLLLPGQRQQELRAGLEL
jgi:hypothetical protein